MRTLTILFTTAAILSVHAVDITVEDTALRSGGAYLIATQNTNGSWGDSGEPAIAGLAAIALHACPTDVDGRDDAIAKAMDFLLGYTDDDGSIHGQPRRRLLVIKGSSYPIYTTSIALLAMATIDELKYRDEIIAGREYLKGVQIDDSESRHYGGYGYGPGKRANLSNTGWSTEALHVTDHLDREPFSDDSTRVQSSKKMWQQLDVFLRTLQSIRATPGANGGLTDADHDGGYAYSPGRKMVSTGAMTYAGLKSMIYAKVDRNDARVRGAMAYIRKNYTIDSEPGRGMGGYYYYLQTMAKALDAYDEDILTTPNGNVRWRLDLITRLAELQRANGSWVNGNGRYFEALPELVTSYAMISIYTARGERE
jgi:squalene-hopene/tetraprenyl-beta-curcumene cyclase